ncbi:MAG: phosphate-starvation-inducible PsiE family protein [Thermoanaerobaculia bacterium]
MQEKEQHSVPVIQKIIARFQRYIVLALLWMMMVVVLLGTIELAVVLITQMAKPPRPVLLDLDEMLWIFNFFLLVLVGLELVEVIKDYLHEDTVHVEVVLLVALIAVARKVIILDPKALDAPVLWGLAAMILALAGGYFVLKKAVAKRGSAEP